MKSSSRNKLIEKIIEMKESEVDAPVKIEVSKYIVISSTISMDAVKELGLTVGSEATAVMIMA